MKQVFIIIPLLLLVSGCAHNLSSSALAMADRTITFTRLRADPDDCRGKFVIVGGVIKALSHIPEGTRMEVEQYPLDEREMPDETAVSGGRFLATAPERLAGSVCGTGQLVTMAGVVVGERVLFREGERYAYPEIAIKELRIVRPPDKDFFRAWLPYGP